MCALIYLNGNLLADHQPHLSALDRGFTLGDGVFETMRAVNGSVFRLRAHLTRLRNSTGVLGFAVPLENDQIEAAIEKTLQANSLTEATIRLAFSRGVPRERGLVPPNNIDPTMVIQVSPFSGYPAQKYVTGFTAVISAIRRNESSPASRIKSANYLDNIFARMEAVQGGLDEAIMLDTAGHLSCASSANLFLVVGDSVMTPAPECGALTGITRGVVTEIIAELGLTWEERAMSVDELLSADEAFLTNSLLGIGPLVRVGDNAIGDGNPGPVTLKVRETYLALIEEYRRNG